MTATTKTGLPAYVQTDVDGLVHGIEEDGFAIVPGALSPELVQQTKQKIDELDFPPGDGRGNGEGIDHHKCVFNRDPFWLQFLDMPGFIDAVERLMGPQSHIIGMSAWRSPPGVGNENPGLHADQIFIEMDEELLTSGRVKLPVFISTLHFYLSDITEDLCPTWVVPGSHKAGSGPAKMEPGHPQTVKSDLRCWKDIPAQPVLVDAGDAMLFRSEVWHSGSKNRTTDRTRYLLQVHYAQRGIAQRFPNFLEWRYNPEVVAAANERQLRLIGKHPIMAYG